MKQNLYLGLGSLFSSLLTFIIFINAKDNSFVALDDYAYIVNNSNIEHINLKSLLFYFTSYFEGNWHPVTMLSLAIDRAFWGLNAYGYHLTNIMLHCGTVLCLCYIFYALARFNKLLKYSHDTAYSFYSSGLDLATDSYFPELVGSVAAALFFGLHPLRVESVVWASERKDVLCIFFIVLSILTYVNGVLNFNSRLLDIKSKWYYLSLLFAVIAQMSKPTSVSLPLILVLIDWYPMGRIENRSEFIKSLFTKIPFIAVACFGAIVTLFSQQIAIRYSPEVSLLSRSLIACKAFIFYIYVTVVPVGLTAFYMHPGEVSIWLQPEYLVCVVLVALLLLFEIYISRFSRIWPAILIFYFITIMPMLGLIQVGGQWAADRYSYLPSIGFAFLWGCSIAYCIKLYIRKVYCIQAVCFLLVAVIQLTCYTLITLRQISVWKNTETLATNIIDGMPDGSSAPYMARAMYRNDIGQYDKALEDIGVAMRISLKSRLTKTYAEIAFKEALILKNLKRYNESLTILDWGVEQSESAPPSDVLAMRKDLQNIIILRAAAQK